MNRRDAHLDAVLRHLGAAYYDSLHGKAAPADVARALDSVAGQIGENPAEQPAADPADHGSAAGPQRRGRWHSRVRDVMTVPVVTVDRITPYKEITRRLAEHQVGGVPGKHRSEFRYGAFARSVTLPERADEYRIRASYDRGVLEVVVNLKDQAAVQADKRIPVRTKAHIKPT